MTEAAGSRAKVSDREDRYIKNQSISTEDLHKEWVP